MKKLLFILLIAFVVTTVVQTEDMELKEYKNINQLIASFSNQPRISIYGSKNMDTGIKYSIL